MKRSGTFRICVLAAALAVASIGLLGRWHFNGQREMQPATAQLSDDDSKAGHIRASSRLMQVSHADRLRAELGQLLWQPGEEAGLMQFEQQSLKFQEAVEKLDPGDLPDALAIVCDLEARNSTAAGPDLELRLLERWAEQDVKSAASSLAQISVSVRNEASQRVGAIWARQDLNEALAWASRIGETTLKESTLLAIASEAADSAPLNAITISVALGESQARDEIISQAAAKWATDDPATATVWVKDHASQELRQKMLAAIAVSWSDQDPAQAAYLAIDEIPSGKLQTDTVLAILQRWALGDAQTAAAWADQFPLGSLRDAATETLTRVQQRLNPALANASR
jgi:hypothetical protein